MRSIEKEDLVEIIRALSSLTAPIIPNQLVRAECARLKLDFGAPPGWLLLRAEENELAASRPRVCKWKSGRSTTSGIGWSLSETESPLLYEAAETYAKKTGWMRAGNRRVTKR